jgi:PAS domain S-box-containing protein
MQFVPQTVMAAFIVMWLVCGTTAMGIWWTRRRYRGFGRWLMADLALFVSLFLLSLRPKAPDWVSMVSANAVLALGAILFFEGAREFRGLPPRVWPTYVGGLATMGILAYFLYGVPNLNARAAVMSTFLGVLFVFTGVTLLRDVRQISTFGLRLTGSLFLLGAVTQLVRAAYCAFGPPLNDVFASTTVNLVFLVVTLAQVAGFPIGFMLLADERVISDLRNAKQRVKEASAEVARRREAEAVLRESERRFRQLADGAPVMIWVSGLDKGVTYVNQPWLNFTGRSLDAEVGAGWADGVHVDDLTRCLDTYSHAFDKRESFQMEYRLRRYDGTYRWILDHGVPVTDLNGSFEGFVGSAIDITNQRDANNALSSLSRRLMEVQETERAWIARELHDDLAQRAVGLAIQLHNLVQGLPGETPERRGFQQTSDHATDLSRDIQRIAYRLHSAKLEHLGLASATQSLCAELAQQHNVSIEFVQENISQISADVALCLFRVAQEALTNAIKHAGVPDLSVALRCTKADVELQVIDGGVGFDPKVTGRLGLGLISMKERLNLVGGQVHIESKLGVGTTVRARVPLMSPITDDNPLNVRV